MKSVKLLFVTAVVLPMLAQPASAQTLQDEIIADLEVVAEKVVSLAQSIPEDRYTWRPMEGARSVGEEFMHIVSANFFFPQLVGVDAPDVSQDWLNGNAEGVDRDGVVTALNASFSHLYESVRGMENLDEAMTLFGRETNHRGYLVTMTTHLHEHLGKCISGARANGIVPAWSGM